MTEKSKTSNPADLNGNGKISISEAVVEDFKNRRETIVKVSNNLTSSRFILSLCILLPAMFCYGYGMTLAGEAGYKDILHMVDNLAVMIITFYFAQQQFKDSNGKG